MITKELVEQWAKESGVGSNPPDYNFRSGYWSAVDYELIAFATLAAAHGAALRDAELMAVSMEPTAWVGEIAEGAQLLLEKPQRWEAVPLYTATQLEAARLQGADALSEQYAKLAQHCTMLEDKLARGERVNQGLIIALKSCWDLGIDSALVPQVRAAIAAAEKERA